MEEGARLNKRQVSHLPSRHHISDCFPHSAFTLIFTYSSYSIIFVLRSVFVLWLSPPDKSRFPVLRMQFPLLLLSLLFLRYPVWKSTRNSHRTWPISVLSRVPLPAFALYHRLPPLSRLSLPPSSMDALDSHFTLQPNLRLSYLP